MRRGFKGCVGLRIMTRLILLGFMALFYAGSHFLLMGLPLPTR